MMDCFCCILDKLCNCFLFNGIWWKDYGIPLLGTVAIPLVVWRLTRYYGADEAEKRKERRKLRDNLNFLKSMAFGTISSLIGLRERVIYLLNAQKKAYEDTSADEKSKFFTLLYIKHIFNYVDIDQYKNCTEYEHNFPLILGAIKSYVTMIGARIEDRNNIIRNLCATKDFHPDCIVPKIAKAHFLGDLHLTEHFLVEIDATIDMLADLMKMIDKIGNVKKFKLVQLELSPAQKSILNSIDKNVILKFI
ncbi:MAG: hypothetical protein IJ099_01450 [Alphaproteobacteria bacterium]|nr:hypothetical protein [Alphaproteobacteria bacterium]